MSNCTVRDPAPSSSFSVFDVKNNKQIKQNKNYKYSFFFKEQT